jgi:hypothetical protein
MKEFQALGLDVSIINDDGETLQLKEIEEAEDREDSNMSIEEVEAPAREIVDDSNDDYDDESDDDFDDDDFDDEDFDENFDEFSDLDDEEGADI